MEQSVAAGGAFAKSKQQREKVMHGKIDDRPRERDRQAHTEVGTEARRRIVFDPKRSFKVNAYRQ